MPESLRHLVRDDSGQGLQEYGMILGLVALVCIAALTSIGHTIQNQINSVAGEL